MLSRYIRMIVLAILLAWCGIAFSSSTEKLDINRATLAELEQLPGMTPAWAQRIIRFRPYKTKLNLVQEGVIPVKLYSRIREDIIAHRDPH